MLLVITLLLLPTAALSLKCMECIDVPDPQECNQITTCTDFELCYVKQYISSGGLILYSSGCMAKPVCSAMKRRSIEHVLRGVVSRRESPTDIVTCEECCNGEYCNTEGCGTKEIKMPQRGPICFSCRDQLGTESCRNVKHCNLGEECALYQHKTAGQDLWGTQCINEAQCSKVIQYLGRRRRQEHDYCSRCCKDDFCNHSCQRKGTSTNTTTTGATSLAPPSAGQSQQPVTTSANHASMSTQTIYTPTKPPQNSFAPVAHSSQSPSVTPQAPLAATPKPQASATTPKPQASATTPKPQVPPSTPNPQASATTPKPQVPPSTPNPQASVTTPKPQVPSSTPNPQASVTTPKPQVPPSTPKPQASVTTPKPQASVTTPKPQVPSSTPKPHVSATTPKPQASATTPSPQASATTPKPQVPSTTPKPQAQATTPKPHATPQVTSGAAVKTTNNPAQHQTTLPPTTGTTSDPAVACKNDGYVYDPPTQLCLKVHMTKQNWTDAMARCQREQGTLAIANTNLKAKEILLQIHKQSSDPSSFFWVGANDANSVHAYRWSTGEVFVYDNSTTMDLSNNNCVLVSEAADSPFSFDKCRTLHYFVCERKDSIKLP